MKSIMWINRKDHLKKEQCSLLFFSFSSCTEKNQKLEMNSGPSPWLTLLRASTFSWGCMPKGSAGCVGWGHRVFPAREQARVSNQRRSLCLGGHSRLPVVGIQCVILLDVGQEGYPTDDASQGKTPPWTTT